MFSLTMSPRLLTRAAIAGTIAAVPLVFSAIPAAADHLSRDVVLSQIRAGQLAECDQPEWISDAEVQAECARIRWASSLANPANPLSPHHPNNRNRLNDLNDPTNPASPLNPMHPLNPSNPNSPHRAGQTPAFPGTHNP
ncbi:hypothetical protein [Nocardia sp. NPDC050710]|uniref:hypothetical protein n=1 Tax=Nocardia sp. NPDC050710 TaxID=3157220 RepID=UPI0033D65D78